MFTQLPWRSSTTVATTLAILAVASSAAARPHRQPPTVARYNIALHVFEAHYDSTSTIPGSDCFAGTETETDSFTSYTFYHGLTIPLKGPGPHAISLRSAAFLLDHPSFTSEGHSPACFPAGPTSYRCQSDELRRGDPGPPRLLGSSTGRGAQSLDVHIESVPHLFVHGANGQYEESTGGLTCADAFNGREAFSPANSTYMPDMFAAKMTWPLASLRKLKQGAHLLFKKIGPAPEYQPPFDCSAPPSVCSQHVRWHANLFVYRVG